MHETAKKLKRRGFLLLEGVLLLAVLSALSVGTTAIFSGQFNTMNAGKQASQAQQYASVEGTYVRIKGYPNVSDLTHDWKDMSDLIGTEDGANWESKVEVARTATTDDGNEMKVVKLSVRKKGDIVSRFSEEIPLVSGLEVYTKDEIDSMFDTVDSEINNLNSDLDAFKNETASNFTQIINNINTINDNLETLRQMIEAEKATREAAINAEHSAWMAALQNEQAARTARDAELTSQITSLQDSLDKLQAAINTEVNQRKAADTTLQNNINSEASARKAADSTLQKNIDTLQNDVNSKYSELKNLYNNLKGRLDGSEFVKSKDAANNISLKYEQKDGESTKSLHGYVDGVEVPLASQNSGSISGTPNYNKPLSYTGGYIGKYGLTFYFFSVKDYGFAYVVGGWNERNGGNTEWNTLIYRLTTSDFEAHLHYVSRFDIKDNLSKYAQAITVTSGALFFVEPGYVYVWCSQGSLPTVYAMN